ncbi:hypothetical protein C427_0885 [Paraglaciecola psychrophila 170]|uniref:Uncharacterized protein n=1 Tax=Paraglaciecola psychrophila 170 TaxID=1129794 RepID=K7AUZ3_9ALTE|nr:hypothetical protein C427_0885 [Paraglaciecola psychrophila 170]GAC39025.1 hypothetical protein GPSY_3414 [Paraglaciecola psychrophila 170]
MALAPLSLILSTFLAFYMIGYSITLGVLLIVGNGYHA